LPGEYSVRLTVHDDKGKKASITHVIRAVKKLEVPDQYSSIQRAIDDAEDGEVVIVSPGTYEENLDFLGKQITVRSEQPNDQVIVDATILTAKESDQPVVRFSSGETRSWPCLRVSPFSGIFREFVRTEARFISTGRLRPFATTSF